VIAGVAQTLVCVILLWVWALLFGLKSAQTEVCATRTRAPQFVDIKFLLPCSIKFVGIFDNFIYFRGGVGAGYAVTGEDRSRDHQSRHT
jgi:hypothetical protein